MFPPMPPLPPLVTTEDALQQVARSYRVSPDRLEWVEQPDRVLLLHTPWARIVVGRTPREAVRRGGMAPPLREALEAIYPHLWGAPWRPAWQLREGGAPPRLRALLRWGLSAFGGERPLRGCWSIGGGCRVLGAWATFPDAVLLEQGPAGAREYQVRLTPWADLD